MMAGQWEVVSKKKNRGDGNKRNPKQQKKKTIDNMPKKDETMPIQESQTMFDAFLEKERKTAQADAKANGTATPAKSKDVQNKKKNQDKKKNQQPVKVQSLEEAIDALNCLEMRTHLATVEARFPESHVIWLQDLASYMNIKLDVTVDPIFSSKSTGYPFCLLSSEIQEFLINTVNRCSSQTLRLCFESCLLLMIQDTVKGLNTVGYRIFLQCLAQEMPNIAVENITKAIDFRNTYQNRQNVCLMLFWALGQAGNNDLEAGLKVWINVMFPVISIRAYSKYVVDYLDHLLSLYEDFKPGKSILGIRELFPVLDFIHFNNGLAANLQKQLLALYPRLKELSYGPNPSSVLRNYFPSYLHRLNSTCPLPMEAELFSSLVECLAIDKHSYSVWRQLYTKHQVQSSLLIELLHEHWDKLPKSFPRKLLRETLSAFQVTNEELSKEKSTSDVQQSIVACNDLMSKMNSQSSFPIGKCVVILTLTLATLLAFDIQLHGSFKSSKTGQLMKDTHFLSICEQASGKINVYSRKTSRWLEVNVPIYTLWLRQTFGPYVQLFWDKLIDSCVCLWHSTATIRSWANKTLPPLLESVSENLPKYAQELLKPVESVAVAIISLIGALARCVVHYVAIVVEWLHTSIFTGSLSIENLQKYAGNVVQTFQKYAISIYNWIVQYFATVMYSNK